MVVSFLILSALSNAVMDFLVFNYRGKNSFWNPHLSWRRKPSTEDVKAATGLKKLWYISLRTVFVPFTDGWHLCQMLFHLFVVLAMMLFVGGKDVVLWVVSGWIIFNVAKEIILRILK